MADNEKGEASAKPQKEKPAKAGGAKKKAEPTGPAPKYKRTTAPRLRKVYDETVRGQLSKEFNYSSSMEIPRVVKISLNMANLPITTTVLRSRPSICVISSLTRALTSARFWLA